jgi:type II secretory pathway pseudopilin PulG
MQRKIAEKRNILRLKEETGIAMLEILISLALLGFIAAAFLAGSGATTRTAMQADEMATAENLGRYQMEYIKGLDYAADPAIYVPAQIPPGTDYSGYSTSVSVQSVHMPDDGLQRIFVSVSHSNKEVFTLEDFKVNR